MSVNIYDKNSDKVIKVAGVPSVTKFVGTLETWNALLTDSLCV